MRYFKTNCLILFISELLVFSLFFSCADALLPELEVNSVSYDSEKLSISLSNSPEPSAFQKGFSFTEDNAAVKGIFEFSGSTVYFYPEYGIRNNYDYKLVLSTQVEDTDGRSLMHDFPYFFTTRADGESPSLIAQFPENKEELTAQPAELFFTFSKPIDTETFLKAFTISPDFQYFCTFSDGDTTAHIIPKESLKKSTRYTISISTNLLDKNRNPIAKANNTVFYHNMDYTENILSVASNTQNNRCNLTEDSINENIPLDAQLEISFSKQTQLDSIAGYISIIPPLSYSIEEDKETWQKIILKPANPEWNNSYRLKIKKGIADFSENKTERDYIFDLKFNNENNRPLSFEAVFFQTSDSQSAQQSTNVSASDFTIFKEDSSYTDLPLDSVFYGKNAEVASTLYLVFRSSENANSLDFYSVLEGFSVSSSNGCCSIELKNASLVSESDYSSELLSTLLSSADISSQTAGKIQIIKFNMEVTNKDHSGFVTLNMDSSIKDCLGNSLKENIKLVLNK